MTAPNLSLNSLFNVEGYVAILTGGGTGIGYWISEALVQNGATVYITGRSAAVLKDAAEKLNSLPGKHGRAVPFTGDITSKDDVQKLVDFVSEREQHVDLLVNNAGKFIYQPPIEYEAPLSELQSKLWDTDMDVWTSQYEANTWGSHVVTTAFLRLLAKAAEKGNGRGSVIFVSSVGARSWNPHLNLPGHTASKASLEHLAKIFSARLYRYGIRLNVLAPGPFATGMNVPRNDGSTSNPANNVNPPLGRSGTAEDIAGAVIWLASRAGAYVTGQTIDVDRGLLLVANGTNKILP